MDAHECVFGSRNQDNGCKVAKGYNPMGLVKCQGNYSTLSTKTCYKNGISWNLFQTLYLSWLYTYFLCALSLSYSGNWISPLWDQSHILSYLSLCFVMFLTQKERTSWNQFCINYFNKLINLKKMIYPHLLFLTSMSIQFYKKLQIWKYKLATNLYA